MSIEKELWDQVRQEVKANSIHLSSWSSHALKSNIKHFLFTFARYKFAAKMLKPQSVVLELGCNDGLGTMLFEQTGNCKQVIGVDFDSDSIQWAQENLTSGITSFIEDDFLNKSYVHEGGADALISLDVIEHIEAKNEHSFMNTVVGNLSSVGFAIIGTPNITMYQYTSEKNKEAHINNYSQERIYELLNTYFHNVFIFGMNDEVLHTGFYPMASYIMAICSYKK